MTLMILLAFFFSPFRAVRRALVLVRRAFGGAALLPSSVASFYGRGVSGEMGRPVPLTTSLQPRDPLGYLCSSGWASSSS